MARRAAGAIAVLAGRCGDDGEDGDGGRRQAAAHRVGRGVAQAAFTEYGKQFPDATARFSFAGSDELAAQIEQGVKPDVFAAANTKLPDELYEKGLVEAPPSSPATGWCSRCRPTATRCARWRTSSQQGVTLADRREDVPVGAYTRTVLDKLPAEQSEAILANVRSEEPDVAGIIGKLTQGAVDAGFVYATDVRRDRRRARGDRAAGRRCSRTVAYGVAPW